MHIKDIEKLTKVVKRIKKLDKEIIKIEKHAIKLATENVECSVDLSFLYEKEEEKKAVLDADGSIIDHDAPQTGFITVFGIKPLKLKLSDEREYYEARVTESTMLHIIDILLKQKIAEREELLNFVKSKTN